MLAANAGCSVAGTPHAVAVAQTGTSAPIDVPVAALPHAPPVATWVTNSVDYQQTLDLEMSAKLMDMGVAIADATPTASRDLAYFICTGLRAHRNGFDLVKQAYPSVKQTEIIGLILAAQKYCLDTV